jgi:hypothetical protein
MSIAVMTAVWEHSKHQDSALLVLLALADFSDDLGRSYPSVSTLAKKARTSERTCQRVLRKLQRSGELEIEERSGPMGCNVYRVSIWHPRQIDGVSSATENVLPGVSFEAKGGVTRDTQPVMKTRQYKRTVNIGNHRSRKRTAAPAELLITDSMRDWANRKGIHVDFESETEAMLDYFRAKGETRMSWEATWRTWMRNAKKFAPRGGSTDGHRFETSAERNERATRQAAESLIRRFAVDESGNGSGHDADGSATGDLLGKVDSLQQRRHTDRR